MKWRKILVWAAGIGLGLIVVAGAGGYFLLKSAAFNQLARRKIAEAADRSTGSITSIGSLDFSILALTAHLHNIVVRGQENAGAPPLLTVREITVAFKIQSLIHRKLILSELRVEHPVANIEVKLTGKSNLPIPPANSGPHMNLFEVGIRHVLVTRGEADYNNREIPINADLYNVNSAIHFETSAAAYAGTISYENGRLCYGRYTPLPHSLNAAFRATSDQLTIESATLKVGSSIALLRGILKNYSDPIVSGFYKATLDGSNFTAFVPQFRPSGNISLIGEFNYHYAAGQPFLASLAASGQLGSDEFSAESGYGRISLAALRASYHLQDGMLHATEIQSDTLGGRVNAQIEISDLGRSPSGTLRASLRGISLKSIQRSLRLRTSGVSVNGIVSGTTQASWTETFKKVRLRSDLTIQAAAASAVPTGTNPVPVNGVIHASYDAGRKLIVLHQSTLRIPSANIDADGELGRHSSLRVQISSNDLRGLESVAAAFRTAHALPPVSGAAQLIIFVRGSWAKPRLSGNFSARNLAVRGSEWRLAQADFQADSSQVAVRNGTLVGLGRARAAFAGALALRDWQYVSENAFSAKFSVQQIPIADLEGVSNLQYPLSGSLSADISLSGTAVNPQGSGTLRIVKGRAYDQPIQSFAAQFQAERGTINSSFQASIPAGAATGTLSFTPATKAYTLQVSAPSLSLQKLALANAESLQLTGKMTIAAAGSGTLGNPQFTASVQIPEATIRGKSLSGVRADLHLSGRHAEVVVDSKIVNSSLHAQGGVTLAGDYYAEASISTTEIPLDALLAAYLPNLPQGLTGEAQVQASLKGPLKDKSRLEAHVSVPVFTATYQSLQIGIVSPIQADFAHSALTIHPAEIRGTDTSIRVQGTVPFGGKAIPSFSAQGSVDLRILKIFSPDTSSSGAVAFNVQASGDAEKPNLNGQILIRNVAVLYAGAPIGVENMNGTLDILKDSVQITKLTAQLGGGDFAAGGAIVYRPNLQFNFLAQAKGIRMIYPKGLRTMLDANLNFTGNPRTSTLAGSILVDSLGFTPDFDLSTFANAFTGETSIPAQAGLADNVKLNVGVESKENLAANSSQVSIEGSLNLRVIGTAADPVITGRADLTSGEVFYRNARYTIQRGILMFNNPTQTSPVLNVSASTTINQYNLTLNLSGPFNRLTTSYSSDPPLATADIISLLASGQTTGASAGQSTDSMIASEALGGITSQFTGGIQKLAGISSLEIDPLIEGSNQNPSARIALQERVTKNLLFTFSTDVSQPGSEIVQGDYQINQRWSVNVTRDQVGGVSVGGELHTRF